MERPARTRRRRQRLPRQRHGWYCPQSRSGGRVAPVTSLALPWSGPRHAYGGERLFRSRAAPGRLGGWRVSEPVEQAF